MTTPNETTEVTKTFQQKVLQQMSIFMSIFVEISSKFNERGGVWKIHENVIARVRWMKFSLMRQNRIQRS